MADKQFITPEEAATWYDDTLVLDTCESANLPIIVQMLTTPGCKPDMAQFATGVCADNSDQPMLTMYGRTFPQSRQIAAYSTVPDATLKYSGSEIMMNHPFPPVLETIRIRLEEELGVKFNHVMLNRYEDGNIYIG